MEVTSSARIPGMYSACLPLHLLMPNVARWPVPLFSRRQSDQLLSLHLRPSRLLLTLPTGTPEQPFLLSWTPDASVPDLLYYQCAVHQKLGWEIRVVDVA